MLLLLPCCCCCHAVVVAMLLLLPCCCCCHAGIAMLLLLPCWYCHAVVVAVLLLLLCCCCCCAVVAMLLLPYCCCCDASLLILLLLLLQGWCILLWRRELSPSSTQTNLFPIKELRISYLSILLLTNILHHIITQRELSFFLWMRNSVVFQKASVSWALWSTTFACLKWTLVWTKLESEKVIGWECRIYQCGGVVEWMPWKHRKEWRFGKQKKCCGGGR